jgi:hypothetical protein
VARSPREMRHRIPVAPHSISNRRVSPPGEVPEPKVRYRIDLPMMVLAFRDNHHAAVTHAAVTIQTNEILEVVGPAQDDRFVIVDVRGEQFLVFDCDLKDHGKLVPDRKSHRAAAQTAGE